MKKEKCNRAVIYTSIWPGEERAHLDEQSVDAQTYCLLQGLDVVEILTDVGSYEEGRIRPGFERLLEKVIANEISHIVMTGVDRACRSTKEALSLLTEAFHPENVEIHILDWDISTGSSEGRKLVRALRKVWELEVSEVRTHDPEQSEKVRMKPLWRRVYSFLQDERYAESLISALFLVRDTVHLDDFESPAVHGGYDHLHMFKALGYRIKAEKTENTKLVADVITRHWDKIKRHLQSHVHQLIDGGTEAVR